jgi:hypothetical protein
MSNDNIAPGSSYRAAPGEGSATAGTPRPVGTREADADPADNADRILFNAGEKRPERTAGNRRPVAPGTAGYPEEQPTPNDDRDMPDENTPHEPQNKPEPPPGEAPRNRDGRR